MSSGKMYKKLVVIVLTVILCLSIGRITSVHARSVDMEYVSVVAKINSDGSMDVMEYYDVRFDGQWNGMSRWINLFDHMEISNIAVYENGEPLTYHSGDPANSTEEITSVRNNQEFRYWVGPVGTFVAVERGGSVLLDWSINANNTKKTYAFQYRVHNAVTVHDDVAELYYQFMGADSPHPFGSFVVQLELPEGANQDEILAWGHGPLYGEVSILSGNEVQWHVSPLPAETMFEGRALFPTSLVPEATYFSKGPGLARILEEEKAWSDESNRERRQARVDLYGFPLVLVAGIGFFFAKRFRFLRYHKTEFVGDYYRELPGAYIPAVLGQLWNKNKHKPEMIMATIMDLGRRGYLVIQEFAPEKKGIFSRGRKTDYRLIRQNKPIEDLSFYEQKLLRFLFWDIGQMDENQPNAQVTLGQIEDFTKKKSNRPTFHSNYEGLSYAIEEKTQKDDFFETLSKKEKIIHFGLVAFFAGIGVVLLKWSAFQFLSIAFILVSIVGALTIKGMTRYSKKGLEDYVRWKAFRKFLQDFSAMDQHQIPSLVIWEQYLVYAIPLGVAKEVIKQLQMVFPNMEQDGRQFGYGWYMSAGMMNFEGFNRMMEDSEKCITRSVKESYKVAQSKDSDSSGGGGGFSGGGGGGAGGGGVDFR
ncbi:Uncharacterized membrane protein [Tindallia magadiensis]|uniref:Uncharacterized membrane protein n=1 Tax=Tindallia magadiensis TaxID=69895 RepID=A0A1I3FDV6_9FIRM|nr:DUF2207 domain-containing protein [Tindallia magadiensis]SFI09354.1 Uncharacterized membrane protein [Tindallia magadiensis]